MRRHRLVLSSQQGDTLIEVSLALSIMSVLLVTAFTLSSLAFRVGQGAKERTQASNLLQEQAEGLHNYRDSHTWAQFRTDLVSAGGYNMAGNGLHVETQTYGVGNQQWQIVGNGAARYQPDISGSPSLYQLAVYAHDEVTAPPHVPSEKIRFDIDLKWPAIGGGPDNHTSLTTFLVEIDDLYACPNGVCP